MLIRNGRLFGVGAVLFLLSMLAPLLGILFAKIDRSLWFSEIVFRIDGDLSSLQSDDLDALMFSDDNLRFLDESENLGRELFYSTNRFEYGHLLVRNMLLNEVLSCEYDALLGLVRVRAEVETRSLAPRILHRLSERVLALGIDGVIFEVLNGPTIPKRKVDAMALMIILGSIMVGTRILGVALIFLSLIVGRRGS